MCKRCTEGVQKVERGFLRGGGDTKSGFYVNDIVI